MAARDLRELLLDRMVDVVDREASHASVVSQGTDTLATRSAVDRMGEIDGARMMGVAPARIDGAE